MSKTLKATGTQKPSRQNLGRTCAADGFSNNCLQAASARSPLGLYLGKIETFGYSNRLSRIIGRQFNSFKLGFQHIGARGGVCSVNLLTTGADIQSKAPSASTASNIILRAVSGVRGTIKLRATRRYSGLRVLLPFVDGTVCKESCFKSSTYPQLCKEHSRVLMCMLVGIKGRL